MSTDRCLPGDWQDQIVRAYTTVHQSDNAEEFGFRFPNLPADFLREKAKKQLRDAFGKWRKMRGAIERPKKAKIPGTASSPDPETFWNRSGIDYSIVRRAEEIGTLIKDFPDGTPDSRRERAEEITALVDSLPDVLPGDDWKHPTAQYIPDDESDPRQFLQYIVSLQRFQAQQIVDSIEPEPRKRDPASLRNRSARRQTIEGYERGGFSARRDIVSGLRQFNESDGMKEPLIKGDPMERLRVYHAAHDYMIKKKQHEIAKARKEAWALRRWGGVPEDDHRRLTELGYNDPPRLVPPDQFDSEPGYTIPDWQEEHADNAAGTVLFRGKRTSSTASSTDIIASMQQAPPDEHYVGRGNYGFGLYFGGSETAAFYASDTSIGIGEGPNAPLYDAVMGGQDFIGDDGAMVRAKIRPDARVIDNREHVNKIKPLLDELVAKLQIIGKDMTPDEYQELIERYGLTTYGDGEPVVRSSTLFAAAVGIDAMINMQDNIVVFNRSALIMPDLGLTYNRPDYGPEPVIPPEPEIPPNAPFTPQQTIKKRKGSY